MAEQADGRLPIGGRTLAPPTMSASDNAARRVELLDKHHQDRKITAPLSKTWSRPHRELKPTNQVQSHAQPGMTDTGMSSTRQSMALPTFLIAYSRLSVAHCLAATKSPLDSSIAKAIRLLTPMPPERPRGSQTTRTRQMVDYDCLEGWLTTHLPAPETIEALVIFTDTRPLDQIGAWRHTHRLWQHRFSRTGPHKERWQGLFVPLTAETGLADVHCTWGGFSLRKPSPPCDQPGTSCSLTPMLHQQLSLKFENSSNSASKSATTASRLGSPASSWVPSRIKTSMRALQSFLALLPPNLDACDER